MELGAIEIHRLVGGRRSLAACVSWRGAGSCFRAPALANLATCAGEKQNLALIAYNQTKGVEKLCGRMLVAWNMHAVHVLYYAVEFDPTSAALTAARAQLYGAA